MESFAKQLENLIDTQIDEIKAGKDIATLAVAYDESYFTFRMMGSEVGLIFGLSRAIRYSEDLKKLVGTALFAADLEQKEFDEIFADNIHFNEKINRQSSTKKEIE